MKFSEAIKRRLPLQLRLPDRYNPLETVVRYVAEVFLVETTHGPAIVWLDPFWNENSPDASCHIAYVRPDGDAQSGRWIDNDPSYGPHCLAWQKPFVMERLDRTSPAWADYKAAQCWRAGNSARYGRKAAWKLVTARLGDLILERRA
jgi:hypothetical protein